MVPVETRLLPAAVAATVAALALVCGSCGAEEPDIYLPIQGFARSSADATPGEAGQGTGRTAASRPLAEHTSELVSSPTTSSPTARFSLVELPAERSPIGVAKRPHHAIGYHWLGAESWLREHGFDAQTCYLPMVRLHTKVSASFNLSGTLWIYGRCSFN